MGYRVPINEALDDSGHGRVHESFDRKAMDRQVIY